MNWGEGYVTEIEYSTSYFAKLAPRFAEATLTLQGHETRGLGRPNYLELGFGQGLSLNIHAAANEGGYWGTDFNPVHYLGAREMADAGGADLTLFEQSFDQLVEREDLPGFDLIVLHGIWSWVSPHNMDVMVDIMRRHLKPGGTVYLSYNNGVGWAPVAPLRELMAQRRKLLGPRPDPAEDIRDGLRFAHTLEQAGARYFEALPEVKGWLDQMTQQKPNYLVHEYFNEHWYLVSFPQLVEKLGEAKLEFADTADPLMSVEELALSEQAGKLVNGIDNRVLREMTLDYFRMTRLRSDFFQRGTRPIRPGELMERLGALYFIPIADPEKTSMTVNTHHGQVSLKEELYQPLIGLLAERGYTPITFAELAEGMKGHASITQLRKMLLTLMGLDRIAAAHPPESRQAVKGRCERLNRHMLEMNAKWAGFTHLASPITGGGVAVSLFEQLFLLARLRGMKTHEQWANFAQARLDTQEKQVIADGNPITDRGKSLDYLATRARELSTERLPILQGLGVAD